MHDPYMDLLNLSNSLCIKEKAKLMTWLQPSASDLKIMKKFGSHKW